MTPKEKARELVDKMSYNNFDEDHNCSNYVAKNCALIAVDEIIEGVEKAFDEYEKANNVYHNDITKKEYWQEVKQEINKL